jgi:hypothetical protein
VNKEFLPLPMAAAITYFRVVEHDEREPSSEGLLDAVASAISVWVPIYGSRKAGEPRARLSDDEVSRGMFSNGASRLRFRDGIPGYENLAILQSDLDAAVRRLQRAGVRFSEVMLDPSSRRVPRVLPRTP